MKDKSWKFLDARFRYCEHPLSDKWGKELAQLMPHASYRRGPDDMWMIYCPSCKNEALGRGPKGAVLAWHNGRRKIDPIYERGKDV